MIPLKSRKEKEANAEAKVETLELGRMASYELVDLNCDKNCTFDTCKSLQRLPSILGVYDDWLYNEDKTKMLHATLNESMQSFTTKQTTNDYKHIKAMKYNMTLNLGGDKPLYP